MRKRRRLAQAPAPPQSQVMMPDAEKIVLLLRTSILTLNDALQTGNFTVLRDMGAPASATPIPQRGFPSPSLTLPLKTSTSRR